MSCRSSPVPQTGNVSSLMGLAAVLLASPAVPHWSQLAEALLVVPVVAAGDVSTRVPFQEQCLAKLPWPDSGLVVLHMINFVIQRFASWLSVCKCKREKPLMRYMRLALFQTYLFTLLLFLAGQRALRCILQLTTN